MLDNRNTYNKSVIVLLYLAKTAVRRIRSHCYTKGVFIYSGRVPLKNVRSNKRLKDEPSAQVYTINTVLAPSPTRVQRRRP